MAPPMGPAYPMPHRLAVRQLQPLSTPTIFPRPVEMMHLNDDDYKLLAALCITGNVCVSDWDAVATAAHMGTSEDARHLWFAVKQKLLEWAPPLVATESVTPRKRKADPEDLDEAPPWKKAKVEPTSRPTTTEAAKAQHEAEKEAYGGGDFPDPYMA